MHLTLPESAQIHIHIGAPAAQSPAPLLRHKLLTVVGALLVAGVAYMAGFHEAMPLADAVAAASAPPSDLASNAPSPPDIPASLRKTLAEPPVLIPPAAAPGTTGTSHPVPSIAPANPFGLKN